MSHIILQANTRGQITLPKRWRSHFKTDTYVADLRSDHLMLAPLLLPSTSAVQPYMDPAEELRRLKEELGDTVGPGQFTGLTADQTMERLEKFYRMQELERLQDLERWRNMR